MNNLKSRKTGIVDLAHISHLPIGIHGRRPEFKAEKPRVDTHFSPLTNAQFSLRPPTEYRGSQLDSQQSYSQAVLTQSQNSQPFSQNSGEDFGLASNYAWPYGSRAQDLINKRPRSPPRSPSHPARASQFPPKNSKDGSNSVLASQASQQSTAQTLLQQISNRPGAIGKNMHRDDMDQRLVAIENCLNGIFGRLDELQKNLLSVEGTIKEATRESDTSRRKSALQQNVLQSLVHTFEEWREEWKRGEAMHNEMEILKLEEMSEEVKKIPAGVGEQIIELKDQILQSLKSELQVIVNSRPQGVHDYLEQDFDGVETRSAPVHATNSVQTMLSNPERKATSSRCKTSDNQFDDSLRVLPIGLAVTPQFAIQGDEMYNSPGSVTATAKKADETHVLFNQHGFEGYGVSPQMPDPTHTQIPQDGGWRSTRLSKTKAIMTEQLPRSSWMESRNENKINNVNIRPAAHPYIENISGEYTFDQCKLIEEVVTVEDEDPWNFPSQIQHYSRRRVEGHQKASNACLDGPSDDGDRQIRQKMPQTTRKIRLQRRASRYSALE